MTGDGQDAGRADRNLETARGAIQRAIGFGLHAAADASDRTTSARQVSQASELRRMLGRLEHIAFEPERPTGADLREVRRAATERAA